MVAVVATEVDSEVAVEAVTEEASEAVAVTEAASEAVVVTEAVVEAAEEDPELE